MTVLPECGYVQTIAHTRFSDFGINGKLHFSKCLMYFEKARFAIAKDAGLRDVLAKLYPGTGISFVVIRVEINVLRAPDTSYDIKGGLIVRSYLRPPFISRLSFCQELADAQTGETLVRAQIDNALIIDGKGVLTRLDDECEACLTRYMKRLESGPIVIS